MSKYTTEVRFICENAAGYNESVGYEKIPDVLEKSWDKIFSEPVSFFDDEYKKILCKKILRHYYLREICSETVGIWKMWMNTKLAEIMPYYNQLYKSELLEFNPLYNTDLTKTHTRKEDTKSESKTDTKATTADKEETTNEYTGKGDGLSVNRETGTITDKKNGTNTDNGTTSNNETNSGTRNGKNLYSDTPQGSISGLESNTYLTNATIDNESNSGTRNANGTSKNTTTISETNENTANRNNRTETSYNDENNSKTEREYNSDVNRNEQNDKKANTLEEYLEKVSGNSGENYSEMLMKYRETFMNIDLLVIDEFRDLFINLW